MKGMAAGPFNNMPGRLALMKQLVGVVDPDFVLETGTFQGRTAKWFRENIRRDAWVVTIESAEKIAGELPHVPGIAYYKGDSGELVPRLVALAPPGARYVCYLDAHGSGSLPLRREVEAITEHVDGVIVIDDFAVPNDPGYTFMAKPRPGDRIPAWLRAARRSNKLLGLGDYTGPQLDRRLLSRWRLNGWKPLWPACSSASEPPPRTGCVVLAPRSLYFTLCQLPHLRGARRYPDERSHKRAG